MPFDVDIYPPETDGDLDVFFELLAHIIVRIATERQKTQPTALVESWEEERCAA